MKVVKKYCVVISVLLMVLSVFALAADEVISIESLTFGEYIDENGDINNDLLSAEIKFSSSVEIEQFSLILSSEEITSIDDTSASKIIYIDQFASPENSSFKFTVEKSRIASAIGSSDINSTLLYVKMGGMGVEDATLMTVIYEEPADEIIYGDATGDSEISVSDAIFLLKAFASDSLLTEQQKVASDVTCDGKVDVSDVIRILQYLASSSTPLGPTN